jgi:Txe/YoeB family toxin of Txe-Axe toxin-antitoxin module
VIDGHWDGPLPQRQRRGACSRRVNIQHRLVHQVVVERIVKVLRL